MLLDVVAYVLFLLLFDKEGDNLFQASHARHLPPVFVGDPLPPLYLHLLDKPRNTVRRCCVKLHRKRVFYMLEFLSNFVFKIAAYGHFGQYCAFFYQLLIFIFQKFVQDSKTFHIYT